MLAYRDQKIKVTVLITTLYNFAIQLSLQYCILFAQAIGASGFDIGLMSCISAIAVLITSPYVGLAIERYSIKKLMMLAIFCEITAMIIFILASDWRWLILAFVLQGQIIRIIPLADIIFVTFTTFEERAKLIGFSRILWGLVNLIAPLLSATIVTYFGGINQQGIRPLFYLTLAILLTILFILYYALEEFTISKNTTNIGKIATKNTISEYLNFLKNEKYAKHWIALRFFKDGFASLLMIFTPLWIVNIKGATPFILGTLSIASALSAIFMQTPVSILSNRLGRKKTYFFLSAFYCMGIILLIVAPDFNFLLLASIVGSAYGGIGGTSYIPLITLWWESVPTESRGKLYGLEGMIFASSKIITSFIGGVLWGKGFMEITLLSPVLIEIAVVIPLLYIIPERKNL